MDQDDLPVGRVLGRREDGTGTTPPAATDPSRDEHVDFVVGALVLVWPVSGLS